MALDCARLHASVWLQIVHEHAAWKEALSSSQARRCSMSGGAPERPHEQHPCVEVSASARAPVISLILGDENTVQQGGSNERRDDEKWSLHSRTCSSSLSLNATIDAQGAISSALDGPTQENVTCRRGRERENEDQRQCKAHVDRYSCMTAVEKEAEYRELENGVGGGDHEEASSQAGRRKR